MNNVTPDLDDAACVMMTDRRSLWRPACKICVFDDRLELHEAGRLVRRLAFDHLEQVRLSVELAGQQTQVVCRASGPAGEIAFGSRRADGLGYCDAALEFRAVLTALHVALEPRWDSVAFVEGQSTRFRLIMAAAGAGLAILAVVFSLEMFDRNAALLAFAGAPFAVGGCWLAWMFRPGRPTPYDPEQLVRRFSA